MQATWGSADVDTDDASLDPYAQLSPRSRRKRKNRDQMRQARQKEKVTMLQLRETVARLEVAFARESKAADERGSGAAAARTSATSAKYAELMATSSRLKEESFRLKQVLHDKLKTQEALERVFGDYWQTAPASPMVLRNALHDTDGGGFARDAYAPMTGDESWSLIRVTHERVRWVEQSFARRAQSQRSERPSYCGWTVRYHTQDGALLFAFEKAFYHVTALQAMEQMWTCELEMKSYRNLLQTANQTLEIVQHVNEDTYVFQRRLQDPLTHKSVTTPYMRFRLKTARGYLLCTKTLEDRHGRDSAGAGATERTTTVATSSAAQDEKVVEGATWGTKMCAWTEFEQDSGACCVARHTGYTNLQSGELNRSVVADTIVQLLRWENAVIGPVFALESA